MVSLKCGYLNVQEILKKLLQYVRDTAIQAGRLRVRFPVVLFDIDITIPALGSTQPVTEMTTRDISLGVKAAVAWG
jgi:hypothetical protein